MHLIIGGIYQGKLDYAKNRFQVSPEEVFPCTESTELDLSKRCFCCYEKYLRACCREGVQPFTDFAEDAIIICRDIFCGIVPDVKEERTWRELAGCTVTAMAQQAQTVTRIFCGIPTVLKKEMQ